jgi:very-short-patch-repair endonuclease
MALQRDCPECGAKAGEKCVGARGSTRNAPHKARFSGSSSAKVVSLQSAPSSDDKLQAILDDAKATAARYVWQEYDYGARCCESPIEKLLVAQFVHPNTALNWDMRGEILFPPSGSIEHCTPPPKEGFYLWPQIKIGPYRVDFVFAAVRASHDTSFVVIECDGHDYHERTKQQAQRDKSRDRYLVGRGFRILRYTGSEIYRDPDAVWDEIIKIVLGLCDD